MAEKCQNVEPKINFTIFPFPGERKVVPTWELSVKISIVASMELIGIVGNILIVLIVLRNKKMRTVTNYYIVNMAVSDFFVACFSIWMHLVDDVTEGWVVGGFLCKFNPFLQITAMCASVFTLISIAGDRFFAIMFPLKSRVTQRKVSIIAACIWMLAAAIATPVLFVYTYKERRWKDFFERFCTDIWPQVLNDDGQCDEGLKSKMAYWICVIVVLNWIPMIVMMVSYTVILIRLRQNRIVPSSGSLSISAIQQRSKQKVVKMLFAILIIFIVCTIPFQVAKLYELFRLTDPELRTERLPDWYNPVYFAAVTLLYSNSAINPLIYGGLNENFRKGCVGLINDIFKRKNNNNDDFNFANSSSRRSAESSANRRKLSEQYKNGGFENLACDSVEIISFPVINDVCANPAGTEVATQQNGNTNNIIYRTAF